MVDIKDSTDQIPELPDGFVNLEEGAKRLARKFHWTFNDGGNIRDAALLEPMNEQSLEAFRNFFVAYISSEPDNDGNNLKTVENVVLPVSEMLKLREGTSRFISIYLKENYTDFKDGVLIIRADAVNIPTPQEIHRYTYAVVENEPEEDLQEYCKTNNVRLLFVYDLHDSVKYRIQGRCGATIRLLEPMVDMIDTVQIENPKAFVESLRVDVKTLLEWDKPMEYLYRSR